MNDNLQEQGIRFNDWLFSEPERLQASGELPSNPDGVRRQPEEPLPR